MAVLAAPRVVRRRPLMEAARRFVRRRKIVQTASVCLLVGMPLLGIFRVDVAGQYMVFLWQRLPIYWLVGILPPLLMIPLGVFFVLSRKFGRLFCSWACPQGAINEMAAKSQLTIWGRPRPWSTRWELKYPRSARRKAIRWLAKGQERQWAIGKYTLRGLLLPPVAGFAAVSYLIDPSRLWHYLSTGAWGQPALLAFVATAGIFYADLLLVQERACRVCFFGYLQSVGSYGQPTGVSRNPELKAECHGCTACRDSCFAGVDPRQRAWEWTSRSNDLIFDNCVSCGDCLLACDDATSRRGVPLIMQMLPVVRSGDVKRET